MTGLLALVTIGQSPRVDVLLDLLPALERRRCAEYGALDDATAGDLAAIAPVGDEVPLVSRSVMARRLERRGIDAGRLILDRYSRDTVENILNVHQPILGPDDVLDPSRIAAQIVSGIGVLGGGVIFVRQNIVNGLTTAATIWVAAAIGMACGAGMPVLAILGTALHLVTVRVLTYLDRAVPQVTDGRRLVIVYRDGRGVLRDILTPPTSDTTPPSSPPTAKRLATVRGSPRPWTSGEAACPSPNSSPRSRPSLV